MSDSYTLKDKNLQSLIRAFKDVPQARVGILGGKTARNSKEGLTNATIGAAHEFGTKSLPIRSFLRQPISDNLEIFLQRAGAFKETTLKEVIASRSIRPWVKKVAVTAEATVLDAFATGGNGKWKPSDMRDKKNHQTLVETQQLRNSISNEVK